VRQIMNSKVHKKSRPYCQQL